MYSVRLLAKHMAQKPQQAVFVAPCSSFDRARVSIVPNMPHEMIEARSGIMTGIGFKGFGASVNNSIHKVLRPYRWRGVI